MIGMILLVMGGATILWAFTSSDDQHLSWYEQMTGKAPDSE